MQPTWRSTAAGAGALETLYTARRIHEPCYGHKVLVEEGSGRILGAHLVT